MVEAIRTPRNAARLFAGLVIAALGTLALLGNFGIIPIYNVWRFWPLALIAIGIAKLLRPSGRFPGLLFLIIGIWFLLQNLGVWHYSLWSLWPAVVVLIGLRLIWGGMGRTVTGLPPDSSSALSAFSILGGSEHHGSATDFRGGDATAILGGCKLDLRQAAIKGDEAMLDVFAMWGGVEILVPRTWSVVLRGTPVLGGFEDKTEPPREPGPRLIVRGTAIMGGVEIKN